MYRVFHLEAIIYHQVDTHPSIPIMNRNGFVHEKIGFDEIYLRCEQ